MDQSRAPGKFRADSFRACRARQTSPGKAAALLLFVVWASCSESSVGKETVLGAGSTVDEPIEDTTVAQRGAHGGGCVRGFANDRRSTGRCACAVKGCVALGVVVCHKRILLYGRCEGRAIAKCRCILRCGGCVTPCVCVRKYKHVPYMPAAVCRTKLFAMRSRDSPQ